jgi:hypothetical protein
MRAPIWCLLPVLSLVACSAPDPGSTCERVGFPELTGAITGLNASYAAAAEIHVGVPVDEDTQRVIVGIYEAGSTLYLGGNAEDVAASSTANVMLYAGVVGGATGTFYLSVELCTTKVCTTPFVRNTYDRADRMVPFTAGEKYTETREHVGTTADRHSCPTTIPIQTFEIH